MSFEPSVSTGKPSSGVWPAVPEGHLQNPLAAHPAPGTLPGLLPPVLFDSAVLSEISVAAAAAYPFEGCGALLGKRGGDTRRVTLTLPLANREEGKPRVRFEVSARDYLAVEDEADSRGLALLGFWHTHPDHPALPSVTDRAFAWEGLLTVIVSVPKRRPREITAWEILGPEAPFTPLVIEESDRARPLTSLAERICRSQED